ncbi:hypothetical protein N9I50_00880 [bacterium]|nr:hypothetical protein [bacterium]
MSLRRRIVFRFTWQASAASFTDTAAAAPLSEVLPLSEAPELAFTGTTSTVAATFAFALLGLGFLTLGEQRRRQDS